MRHGKVNRMSELVPYFSQWESPALVGKFISGDLSPASDPNWLSSGASSQEEYAKWSSHLCGMACFK